MRGALLDTAHALGGEGDKVALRFSIPVDAMQEKVPLSLKRRNLHLIWDPMDDPGSIEPLGFPVTGLRQVALV